VTGTDDLARGRGWAGIGFVELDGANWTVPFASKMLDFPEKDLRDLIRITGLPPAGVLNMRDYKSQGRAPRAYPAEKLIMITETAAALREKMNFPGTADKTPSGM
jgi:hypothetical protein